MNLKIILQIIVIIILLGVSGFLVYDNFFNEGQIQEEVSSRINPFQGIVFPSSSTSGIGDTEETSPEFVYDGDVGVGEEPLDEDTTETKILNQISSFPVSGWIFIDAIGDSPDSVRYTRVSDGTIFERALSPEADENIVVKRFIPNVELSLFSGNANNVLLQYWNNLISSIETYAGSIEKIVINAGDCPFSFPSKPKVGDQGDQISALHEFLNRDQRTSIVFADPTQTATYTEQSDIAVKNFQSIYGLSIDGVIGAKTIAQMEKVCLEQQKQLAEAEQNSLEEKYTFSGYFLPDGIISFTRSPSGEQYFYIFERDEESFGIVGSFANTNTNQIFQSPFTDWVAEWVNSNLITLTTKPSAYVPGYMFSLNPKTENFLKTLGEINGLQTKTSPNGESVLYSYTEAGELKTAIYNILSKAKKDLEIVTLADKCAWTSDSQNIYCAVPNPLPGGVYPDDWYKGIVSLSDEFYKINANTLVTEKIHTPETTVDVDMIEISQNRNYLLFRNKIDETLWALGIGEAN